MGGGGGLRLIGEAQGGYKAAGPEDRGGQAYVWAGTPAARAWAAATASGVTE
jgi:hypothetical protein